MVSRPSHGSRAHLMLEIGSFQTRDCQASHRRAFLRASLALPLLWPFSRWAAGKPVGGATSAKSILLIWLGGGPSHLDLFDPKPSAPVEYRGPFSTIATRISGVRFTELVPKLAERSDRFSLIRTNVNFDGDHLI